MGKGGLGVGKGDRRMNKCTVFPSHPRLKQMKKSSCELSFPDSSRKGFLGIARGYIYPHFY